MNVVVPDSKMFSDPETQKKFAPDTEKKPELPPGKDLVRLSELCFTVKVFSAPGTRWLISAETLEKNFQGHCSLVCRHHTTGQIPLVIVRREESKTPIDALMAFQSKEEAR